MTRSCMTLTRRERMLRLLFVSPGGGLTPVIYRLCTKCGVSMELSETVGGRIWTCGICGNPDRRSRKTMKRRFPAAVVCGLVALSLAAFLNSTHPVFSAPGDPFVPGCPYSLRKHRAAPAHR